MQALYITANQWDAFTQLCSSVGAIIPRYVIVSHPITGELGHLVDKAEWDTVFIAAGIRPILDF